MMVKKTLVLFLLLSAVLFVGVSGCGALTEISTRDVPRIQPDELKARLNDPALVLIDVRADGDWEGSMAKIKGALREDGDKVAEWASKYPKDKTIVLYCA